MHLIFERPRGRFKSNCNILALAWTPYYNETKFRRAQLEQHHRLTSQWPTVNGPPPAPPPLSNYDYGRMEDFGWLAIGNIGKLIGVTLTSSVPPPKEIDGRRKLQQNPCDKQCSEDLILLDDLTDGREEILDETNANNGTNGNQAESGEKEPKMDDFDKIRPDRKWMRSNYNLRGHRDEIILVQWNEYYQKLATVDSKGNVLIWCKANEKFTIQTPFYNRSKSVADFKWSNDGKTALICYTDSFILVGGSSGQRHWHSMLNLDDYHITCAVWTPNDEQLLLGVSNGNVVLIDLPHSELTEMMVGEANIRTMCWSSSQLNTRHFLNRVEPLAPRPPAHSPRNDGSSSHHLQGNSSIVNRRRLSMNCALFCRHCPSTVQGAHNRDCTRQPDQQLQQALQQRHHTDGDEPHAPDHHPSSIASATATPAHKDILAIDFANNTIKLFESGLRDAKPREIQVGLESYLMAWSSSGETLAVAGFNIFTSAPSAGYLRCKYLNAIKFYSQKGRLIYEHKLNFTRYPITALTWAHQDQRLFVATGPRLHCARVFHCIPSLSLLALSCLHKHTKTMDKADVLKGLLQKQLVPTVLSWQSFNCPLELTDGRAASSTKETKAQRQQSDSASGTDRSGSSGLVIAASTATDTESGASGSDSVRDERARASEQRGALENNINVAQYHLPAKLKAKIDQLFVQTLRQPYDEQLTFNDIIWHVPKSQQRHYCTLICYTHELPDMGALGRQYSAQEPGLDTSDISNILTDHHQASDQYKIFILYVEYQGSLIPILKARRIGFLKPEFVIFDPERAPDRHQLQRYHKVSDMSNNQQFRRPSAPSNPSSSQHSSMTNNHRINQQTKRILMRDLPTQAINNCDELHNPTGSDSRWSRLGLPSPKYSNAYLTQPKQAIESYTQSTLKTLPETRELVRIRSNIWGTKFKLVNVGNQMIGSRALLGSVVYKASILHLQPRQIFLNIKDMSNYCVLCSMHHHTRLPPDVSRRSRHLTTERAPGERVVSLIDSPLVQIADCLATPVRASSTHNSLSCQHHRHNRARVPPPRGQTRAHLGNTDKVILPVGDNIRVAPKLELNQRYKFAGDLATSNRQPPFASAGATKSVGSTPRRRRLSRPRHQLTGKPCTPSKPIESWRSTDPVASTSSATCQDATAEMMAVDNNDILTLSLDQGDQVRVEMSSLSDLDGNHLRPKKLYAPAVAAASDPLASQRMDEFMQANKTLRSIQTITKMIVDLSSRAQGDEEKSTSPIPSGSRGGSAGDDNDGQQSSPAKLFKASEGHKHHHHHRAHHNNMHQKSVSQRYIPPDTPVHKPYRLVAAAAVAKFSQGSQPASFSQSATNTPLKMATTNRRQRRAGNHQRATTGRLSFDSECPLPLPPPSVPFRRKLSSSAKRFFDGSLRSLTGLGSAGPGGYTTSEDFDSEDCEALVSGNMSLNNRRRRKRAPGSAGGRHQSQPCSPLRHGLTEDDTSRLDRTTGTSWFNRAPHNNNNQGQSTLDLSQLRAQVVQKLRQTTSWLSASSDKLEIDVGKPGQSCTKRSRWVHKSGGSSSGKQTEPRYTESIGAGLSSNSSSSSSASSSSSSGESLDFSSSDEDDKKAMSFINQALVQTRWFKKSNSSRHSASAKDLNELGRMSLDGPAAALPPHKSRSRKPEDRGRKTPQSQRRTRRRRRTKKSICQNSNCCCSREIKLSNRPPVWNEYSQVYQLDFGGRVTQESAKNLQIDFNGNLALQFGRVDKCTYTLDYKYPFNAVQAMSIALASLTQRLK